MSLLRIDGSIQGERSVSRAVANTAEAGWQRLNPDTPIVRRDLAIDPIPGDALQLAVSARGVPDAEQTSAQRAAVALSNQLTEEFLAAEAYLFAFPLYNYGPASNVKAWIDMILVDLRLVGHPATAKRPAVLIVSRGGGYGAGSPREGWDHATPFYQRIFGDMMGIDLHTSEIELTMAHVVPAMESLRGLATESLKNGHATADSHGETIARKVLEGAAA